MIVLPSMAFRLWNGRHPDKHPLDLARVARYADSLASGTWDQHSPFFATCPAGHLWDGRHHLAAIILTGRPAPMWANVNGHPHHDWFTYLAALEPDGCTIQPAERVLRLELAA